MKLRSSIAALALVLAAVSVSCDKIRPPQPQLQPAPATSEQPAERAAFTQAAQKEIDELRDAIAGLKSKAEAAGAQTRAKLLEEVQKLETGLGEVQQNLGQLKDATVESWNQMKDSFNSSLDKLKSAVKDSGKNAT